MEADATVLGRLVDSGHPLSVGAHAGVLAVLCLRLGALPAMTTLVAWQRMTWEIEWAGHMEMVPPTHRFDLAMDELAAMRVQTGAALCGVAPFHN